MNAWLHCSCCPWQTERQTCQTRFNMSRKYDNHFNGICICIVCLCHGFILYLIYLYSTSVCRIFLSSSEKYDNIFDNITYILSSFLVEGDWRLRLIRWFTKIKEIIETTVFFAGWPSWRLADQITVAYSCLKFDICFRIWKWPSQLQHYSLNHIGDCFCAPQFRGPILWCLQISSLTIFVDVMKLFVIVRFVL